MPGRTTKGRPAVQVCRMQPQQPSLGRQDQHWEASEATATGGKPVGTTLTSALAEPETPALELSPGQGEQARPDLSFLSPAPGVAGQRRRRSSADSPSDPSTPPPRPQNVAVAYENQRRIAVFGFGGKFNAKSLMLTDRAPWTDQHGRGDYKRGLSDPALLPPGCHWCPHSRWMSSEWEHAFNFSHLGLPASWTTEVFPTDSVRRRRWERRFIGESLWHPLFNPLHHCCPTAVASAQPRALI